MSDLRDDPPLSVVETPTRHPSRVRVIVAVIMLTAIGLLVAASGFASRHYVPAPTPSPGTYMPPIHAGAQGPSADHC